MLTKSKIEEIAKNLGWSIEWNEQNKWFNGQVIGKETYAEFFQESPAGEDFSFVAFYTDMDNLVEEVARISAAFDIEEHVKLWLGGKGAPGVVELVQDAKDIDKMIQDLAIALACARDHGSDCLSKRTAVKYDIYVHLTGEVEVVGDYDTAKASLEGGCLLSDVEESLHLQELLESVGVVQGIATDTEDLIPGSLEIVD